MVNYPWTGAGFLSSTVCCPCPWYATMNPSVRNLRLWSLLFPRCLYWKNTTFHAQATSQSRILCETSSKNGSAWHEERDISFSDLFLSALVFSFLFCSFPFCSFLFLSFMFFSFHVFSFLCGDLKTRNPQLSQRHFNWKCWLSLEVYYSKHTTSRHLFHTGFVMVLRLVNHQPKLYQQTDTVDIMF